MRVDHRLLGIDAARQIIHHHVVHVVLDVLGGVAVGDHLVVGDEHVGARAHVLKFDAAFQRAEVVAEMQPARRAVARQHRVFLGMSRQVGADLVAALLARLKASFVCHGWALLRIVMPPACGGRGRFGVVGRLW